jgi:small-conductance mechanosensitive channel
MVIAFAAQDSLSNFFSGIFLLLDRPFEEGHQIILEDGEMYEVRKIGLRTTRLFRFKDATVVSIPNNSLVNAKVARFTGVRDKGVMHYKFGVAYGSDPARVKEIIRDAVKRCAQVADDPPPVVRFEEMGADAIIFYAQVRVKERGDRHLVTDFLNTEIYGALNRAGIEIPFPQRTVWLRQEKGEKAKLGEAKGG